MYKLKNQIAPDHLAQIFNSTNYMNSYNLKRSTNNLFVPRPYTEAGKNSAASFIEGRFSGIVYQILLKADKPEIFYFTFVT